MRFQQIHFVVIVVCGIMAPLTASVAVAQEVIVDANSVARYVFACRKPNGAFGPLDQAYTDAAWNYPAVHTLVLLDQEIADKDAILKNGVGFPQGHGGYGHWLFFHQRMIRKLLGATDRLRDKRLTLRFQGYKVVYYGSPFGTDSNLMFRASDELLAEHIDRATSLQYYNLSSLYYLLAAIDAAGMRVANPDDLVAFITCRQAPGGGFVDVRIENGKPSDREAHIAHTFHAVGSLQLLGSAVPNVTACVRFVQSCQLPSGTFRWNPDDDLPGNYEDIYYTWAAVRVMDLLGKPTPRCNQCVEWINSLQNHDGGFGDKPGWRSRLYSTFYAVHSLAILSGSAREGITKKMVENQESAEIADDELQIFQGLHKMPVVAPQDLPELSRRKFNLIALKTDKFEQAKILLKAIRADDLPMDVVLCPEAYPHRARRHGGTLLDHIANVTLDPQWTTDERAIWQAADQAGQEHLPWRNYQQQVIAPVLRLGGLFYPEHEFEMEYGYSAYDDGVMGRNGYNAVLAGFNWPPRDFVRVFPWRERYVDKLTPIADADAHGDLQKWSEQLDHTRHLFIAKGPSYAEFLDAAADSRVVCVVHGAEDVPGGVTFYGPPAAVNYVKNRVDQWRWWTDGRPIETDER